MKYILILFTLFWLFVGEIQSRPISTFQIDQQLGSAFVRVQKDCIVANTGKVERTWKWNSKGLATLSLLDLGAQREWVSLNQDHSSGLQSDWGYLKYTNEVGELINLSARISDDEGFAAEHIELVAEVKYSAVSVKYLVWVFPEANGFSTHLQIKKNQDLLSVLTGPNEYDITPKKGGGYPSEGFKAKGKVLTGRTEGLPIETAGLTIRGIGYYNHTQGRNHSDTPILHEEIVSFGEVAWASVLSLEKPQGGLIFVKESHKCVNQTGVNTGVFNISKDRVESTGWGILPKDLTTDYQGLWANWLIVHNAQSKEERELAIKQFDRIRYPIDPARDIYIMANTWGTGETKNWSQSAARESNVRIEINSQADLGIDVQQIDDGWQGWATTGRNWRPVPLLDYSTKPGNEKSNGTVDGESYSSTEEKFVMYPNGWSPIRDYAKEKGIRLGLWCFTGIPLEDLKWNYDQGGFGSYKIDFVNARNFDDLNNLIGKIREFSIYTDHQVRVNWDVTEHPPRLGYFFGRQYGNIYLSNRKTLAPEEVVYVPYLVLRDAWHVSKYLNLNKFQISVQNGDRCNKLVSDAFRHDHDYLVAQTLMGSPIFFQETHYYSEQARAQIKPLLAVYKMERKHLYDGFVFPIGDEPDNCSWSGFQNYHPDGDMGYILMFRQLENQEIDKSVQLKFISNKKVKLSDLRTGKSWYEQVDTDGFLKMCIEDPGSFQFLKYELH